jgi:hypothetical protein
VPHHLRHRAQLAVARGGGGDRGVGRRLFVTRTSSAHPARCPPLALHAPGRPADLRPGARVTSTAPPPAEHGRAL